MMMKSLISLATTFCLSQAYSVEIFTTKDMPIYNLGSATPCVLGTNNMEAINAKVKAQCDAGDCPSTEKFKQQYMGKMHKVGDGMLCSFKAFQLGVKKLPAIIFDHDYVIYGVDDLDQARSIYQQYQVQNHA